MNTSEPIAASFCLDLEHDASPNWRWVQLYSPSASAAAPSDADKPGLWRGALLIRLREVEPPPAAKLEPQHYIRELPPLEPPPAAREKSPREESSAQEAAQQARDSPRQACRHAYG